MSDELRKDWPDLWFTAFATTDGERDVQFRIFKHEGQSVIDDEPAFDEKPDLTGWVKWDGCSNWEVDGYFHSCSRAELEQLGQVLARCWDWAAELLPRMTP